MKLADLPDVLTVEQCAEVLHIARGTAYEGVRAGEIPSVRVGRCIRVPRHALERMLTAAGTDSPQTNGAAGTAPQEGISNDHDTPSTDGAGSEQ